MGRYTDIHSLLSCVIYISTVSCCYTDIHSLLSCVVIQSLGDGAGRCIGIAFTHLLLMQNNYFERVLRKFETCHKEVLCIHAKLPLLGVCYLPVYSYKSKSVVQIHF